MKASIRGLQISPVRKLITTEGRILISEDEFTHYHQQFFPGKAIPKLIRHFYEPDFARIIYLRIAGAEEPPVIRMG